MNRYQRLKSSILANFAIVTSLVLILSACASAPIAQPPTANPDDGTLQGTGGDVVIVPQWHLSPTTNSTLSSAGLPQSENQRAIYRQLTEWFENGKIRTAIVEGCEGEINDGFTERYNGWTLADLQKLTAEQLDHVMTQVGLKLKAKLGRKARVVCGDSLPLIKKHQLILSDIRGLVGFRMRIDQFKNDLEKRADYVATARDVLKMPASADEDDVLNRIDEDLRAKMDEFKTVLSERDAAFVAQAERSERPAALVIGAIHVADLQSQLQAAKLATSVFTPRGLKGDEAEILAQVTELLAKPASKLPPERRTKLQPDSGPARK